MVLPAYAPPASVLACAIALWRTSARIDDRGLVEKHVLQPLEAKAQESLVACPDSFDSLLRNVVDAQEPALENEFAEPVHI